MKFNRTYLEELNDKINSCDYFTKATANNKKKKFTYQIYNRFCTCVIRIRETSKYLEDHFKFKKTNEGSEAFDFYEFINLVSIIEGCCESLFYIFNYDFKSLYRSKNIFKISNKGKCGDLTFFKFVRSASTMHPSETTNHNDITKHKFESYPYLIWINEKSPIIFDDSTPGSDIEMLSWNCKTKGRYKRYYLSSNEFIEFCESLLINIKELLPVVDELIDKYKEKLRCKQLKSSKDFDEYSKYVLYLRKRIESKLKDDEWPDGGLLLAAYIINNPKIGKEFKKYIKSRVKKIANKMLKDITKIDYDEIINNLDLYVLIKDENQGWYTTEKFNNYLRREAILEIENNSFKKIDFNAPYGLAENARFSAGLLSHVKDKIYVNNGFDRAYNYAELYILTLEAIYLKTIFLVK